MEKRIVNATTTATVLDDLKGEERADWIEPDLHLVLGTKMLGGGGSQLMAVDRTSYQVVSISGRVSVSF